MVFTREQFDRLAEEGMVLRSENDQLKTENLLLKEKIQYLIKKLFGRSSEKLNPDQMQLALEELRDLQATLKLAEAKAEETEEAPEEKESKRGKRKLLPKKRNHPPCQGGGRKDAYELPTVNGIDLK